MNLLLLVGVGFFLLAAGALIGRYYVPDRRPLKRAAEEGRAYVRGLVEVLEGDQDAAIGEISRALKENTKTVEAYFALATLFRNRGEHERAVRVHQALLMRRDIDKKTRLRIHLHLALDFKAAGFPKRAVRALEYVIAKNRKHTAALRELAALYEETGQWERAAGARRLLGKATREDTGEVVAHLFAARAAEAIESGDLGIARKALRRAISAHSDSVHALHVLARYQQRQGRLDAAVKAWTKALGLAPELAVFFVPRLEEALFELGKLERLDRTLEEQLRLHPGHPQLRLAAARFDARRSPRRALATLTELLAEQPALLPARHEAGRLTLEQGDPEQIRRAFEELLATLGRASGGYRCQACGHAEKELFWRCSNCLRWGSAGVAWGRRAGERAAKR